MISPSRFLAKQALGAALIGFGATKLLAQLFLASWQILSRGESDIAARGIWLLAAFLPQIAAAGAAITVVLVSVLARRTGRPLAERLGVGVLGGTTGALMVFFGADPFPLLLGFLPWPSSFSYYLTSAVIAMAILLVGGVTIVRAAQFLGGKAVAA